QGKRELSRIQKDVAPLQLETDGMVSFELRSPRLGFIARSAHTLSVARHRLTTVRGKCATHLRRSGEGRSPGLGANGALRFCLDPGLRRDDNTQFSRTVMSRREIRTALRMLRDTARSPQALGRGNKRPESIPAGHQAERDPAPP